MTLKITLKANKFYLSVAAIALISWGLLKLISDGVQQGTTTGHGAEYFGTGYVKWEMDEFGKLKNKLVAARITHFEDGITHSIKPVMFFYNETTPPWVITAEAGVLSADGKYLFLKDKSIISRAKAEGVQALTINTSNLRIKLETSYAETGDWAELISPPNVTTGTGMKMVFVTPIHLELLANVKGKYETN